MKFYRQNPIEYWMGWHDYIAIIIHEFPILLVRKDDWLDIEMTTLIVQILGFTFIGKFKKKVTY